jgi:hypothetical protein
MANFWSDIIDDHTGPPLTEDMVKAAEAELGYKLPAAYINVLISRNGGYPRKVCFPTTTSTSWANDHVQINTLYGVGPDWGVGRSPQLVRERRYPKVGLVIADTSSGCNDAIMLDYTAGGPYEEPRVVYVEAGRSKITVLAPDFESFLNGLVDPPRFADAETEAGA